MARNADLNLDMDKVAELARIPREQAEAELLKSGAVMRTPGGGFEPTEVYLSGNVRRKLREAQSALANGEDMKASVDALTEALPRTTPYYEIEAKLGAPWVDNDTYKQFVGFMLGLPEDRLDEVHVQFAGARWRVGYRRQRASTAGSHRSRFATQYVPVSEARRSRDVEPHDQDPVAR